MSSKKKIYAKGRIEGAWTPLRHEPMNSPTWKHTSFGARLLYIALLRRLSFTNYNNGRVYLSTRKAAEEIGANKETIVYWYRELQHYGFVELVEPGTLGAKGRAAHWRITDMGWGQIDGRPVTATKDYRTWSGELFEATPKTVSKVGKSVHPVRKTRTVPSGKSVHPVEPLCTENPDIEKPPPLSGKPVHTKYHHLPEAEGRESAVVRDDRDAAEPVLSGLPEWTAPKLEEIEYTDELRQLYRCEVVEAEAETPPVPDVDQLVREVLQNLWPSEHTRAIG